jgi:hypothetical protein
MVAGVDEVRPDLEGRHGKPPSAKGGDEAQRDRGFAAAAFRPGNDEPFDGDLLKCKKPSLRKLGFGAIEIVAHRCRPSAGKTVMREPHQPQGKARVLSGPADLLLTDAQRKDE